MPMALPSMTRAIQYDVNAGTFRTVAPGEDPGTLAHDAGHLLWLDLKRPSEAEMAELTAAFGLHPLAVEDALHGHQRPKIEEYDAFFLLVFYDVALAATDTPLRASEIRLFVGAHYLITIHDDDLACVAEAARRWTRNPQQVEWGIGILLYSLLDTVVDQYFPVTDQLVEQAEALTDRIYGGQQNVRQDTFDLLALKRKVLEFRRLIAAERDVLNVLTNRDSPVFNPHTLLYFRDVYDHVARLADTLDLYRDQVTSTMDATLAIASNDLNKVMRTLTAMSIILMSDALISGIYGMNFINIPELHWPLGYAYALLLMAGVSYLLWRYFKHLKWL